MVYTYFPTLSHTNSFPDNNNYYYQDTPVDELANHLRDRDVQYAIKHRFERKDREDLFKLMDSLVTPVFKEDMTVLNSIADIFAKYEDVHLVFTTEPRLPRIRRLDVFSRLLPRPDEEGPSQEEQNTEIGENCLIPTLTRLNAAFSEPYYRKEKGARDW